MRTTQTGDTEYRVRECYKICGLENEEVYVLKECIERDVAFLTIYNPEFIR